MSTKKIARIVGVLFIIATVAAVLSVALLSPVLSDLDYLTAFPANETQVVSGVILDLVGAAAFVGLAVVIYPSSKSIMKRSPWGISLRGALRPCHLSSLTSACFPSCR